MPIYKNKINLLYNEFTNKYVPKEIEPSKQYPPFIRINDDRSIRATTGASINPNRDLKSGNYNAKYIHSIVKAAKDRNYDPYRALAVDMMETTLGKNDDETGHVLYSQPETLERSGEYELTPPEKMIDALIYHKKEANKKGYNNATMELQHYNGLDRLTPKTESSYYERTNRNPINKSWYGVRVPKEGYIDMKKNPLFGIEGEDLRSMLMRNQDIKNMADTVNNKTAQYTNIGKTSFLKRIK